MRSLIWITLALLIVGCGQQANGDQQADNDGQAGEPITAADTLPSTPAAPAAADGVSGSVLETFNSGGYTYVRLDTPDGETWAAVSETTVAEGDQVTITGPMEMQNFNSPSLDRTFDRILFGGLSNSAGSASAPAAGGDPHAGLDLPSSATAAVQAPTDVERAEGDHARTVAEIHSQSADLAGSRVSIRGQVVKFNANIMGVNWIHLQDGSGDAAAGSNDITVTSSDTVAVGEVVLLEGTVVVDKDFGAGYSYAVLIEDATIER